MDASHDGRSLPQAGWFADSQNPAQERWWDGATWTEFRRNRTESQPVPPAAPAYGSSQAARTRLSPPGRSAAVFGVVAGVLSVLGFLMLVLGGSAAPLNFLLWLGLLAVVGGLLCGIVAVILAVVAAARHVR